MNPFVGSILFCLFDPQVFKMENEFLQIHIGLANHQLVLAIRSRFNELFKRSSKTTKFKVLD